MHSSLGGYEGFALTRSTVFALVWSVFVMSIAAILIMLWLLQATGRRAGEQPVLPHARRSAPSRAPSCSTSEWGRWPLVGLVVALAGVALTLRPTR